MIRVIILSLVLVSCSHFIDGTKELSEKEKQLFLYDFSSTNQKISADIRLNNDITKLTIEQYLSALSKLKAQKAVNTADRLKKFNIKELKSDSKFFYLCVYSETYDFGACDSTKCSNTEMTSVKPVDFISAFDNLKTFNCDNNSLRNEVDDASQ